MLAALVLGGYCAAIPLFDMTGPVCAAADEQNECQCSECMTWAPSDGADHYLIERTGDDGMTRHFRKEGQWCNYDPAGPADSFTPPPTSYCFAKDDRDDDGDRLDHSPLEGWLYHYRVAACIRDDLGVEWCSAFSESHDYRGAPYLNFSD